MKPGGGERRPRAEGDEEVIADGGTDSSCEISVVCAGGHTKPA